MHRIATMKSLETDFREARVRLNKTQGDVAREAGVSRKTVSDFEVGMDGIRLANLKRLLQCVGLQLAIRPLSTRPVMEELGKLYPDEPAEPSAPPPRPRARRA